MCPKTAKGAKSVRSCFVTVGTVQRMRSFGAIDGHLRPAGVVGCHSTFMASLVSLAALMLQPQDWVLPEFSNFPHNIVEPVSTFDLAERR